MVLGTESMFHEPYLDKTTTVVTQLPLIKEEGLGLSEYSFTHLTRDGHILEYTILNSRMQGIFSEKDKSALKNTLYKMKKKLQALGMLVESFDPETESRSTWVRQTESQKPYCPAGGGLIKYSIRKKKKRSKKKKKRSKRRKTKRNV